MKTTKILTSIASAALFTAATAQAAPRIAINELDSDTPVWMPGSSLS